MYTMALVRLSYYSIISYMNTTFGVRLFYLQPIYKERNYSVKQRLGVL
jgi:hypothetical protein